MSKREAIKIASEYNRGFDKPLDYHDFEYAINRGYYNHEEHRCPHLHGEGYIIKPKKLANILRLDSSMAYICGFTVNEVLKEERVERREVSIERDVEIAKMYLSGMGYRTVAKELSNYMACSHVTVKNAVERLGIKNRGVKFEEIDFIGKQVYTRKGKEEKQGGLRLLINTKKNPPSYQNVDDKENQFYPFKNKEQKEVYEAIMNVDSVNPILLLGVAGSGKTTVVKKAIEDLTNKGIAVAVCAYTEKAARNYRNGMTCHKFFALSRDGKQQTEFLTYQAKKRIAQYDVIFVDEVSFLSFEYQTYIEDLKIQSAYENGKMAKIVYVGDGRQLGAVNGTSVFSKKAIPVEYFDCYYLDQNVRAYDPFHSLMLERIANEEQVADEANRIYCVSEKQDEIYLVGTNAKVKKYNEKRLAEITGKTYSLGIDDLNNRLQVKVGCKVVFTRNEANQHRYYNGQFGRIVSIRDNYVDVMLMDNDGNEINVIKVRKTTHENDSGIKVTNYPFTLGYAITVHKSQGMTLNAANIDPELTIGGQLYVALSRVRTASGVHLLAPIKNEYIVANPESLEFMQRFVEYVKQSRMARKQHAI